MKKSLFITLETVLIAILTLAQAGCSNSVTKGHTHTYATDWSYDDDYHWLEATCEHIDEIKDKAEHEWDNGTVITEATENSTGLISYKCIICEHEKSEIIPVKEHVHTFESDWSYTEERHWKKSTCIHTDEVESLEFHKFGYFVYNNDATQKQDGTRTKTCSICNYKVTESAPGTKLYDFYEYPVDAGTGLLPTKQTTHVLFGVYPKTVVPLADNKLINENESITVGANTYYKGANNKYYAKVKEKAFKCPGYTYSDNTKVNEEFDNTYRYFEVEPIRWRLLEYKNQIYLVSTEIIEGYIPYCNKKSLTLINGNTIYNNNYKYSSIRAWLNGKYEDGDIHKYTDDIPDVFPPVFNDEPDPVNYYENNGFLQTAFTSAAQQIIKTTVVQNEDVNNRYACENTKDKVFLLSKNEISALAGSTQKNPTDYAIANHVEKYSTGGYWMTRTPYNYGDEMIIRLNEKGSYNVASYTSDDYLGIVPALIVDITLE